MCNHQWEQLYKEPEDRKFLELYKATGLDRWRSCTCCNVVGKMMPSGKIQIPPSRKHAGRRADAKKWRENLARWES